MHESTLKVKRNISDPQAHGTLLAQMMSSHLSLSVSYLAHSLSLNI